MKNINGYIVHVHSTAGPEDVASIKRQDFIYPLSAMLQSAYEDEDERLRDAVTLHEYHVFASDHFASPALAFYEQISFFATARPDFIGISCYFWSIDLIQKLCAHLRATLPDTTIILGGPHTVRVEEAERLLVENPAIDFVVRGQGERPFAALMKWMVFKTERLDTVSSLSYRSGEDVRHNPLQFTPPQELPQFANARYLKSDNPNATFFLYTSMGCPNNCAYCGWYTDDKKQISRITAERAIEDLTYIFDTHPEAIVCYADAFMFGGSNVETKVFLRQVAALRREKPDCRVLLCGNLNYINADKELIALAREARYYPLSLGLQSHDESVWLDMGRPAKQYARLFAFAEYIRKAGLVLRFDLIVGLPTQSRDSFLGGLEKLIETHQPDGINFNLLQIYDGTRYFQERHKDAYRIKDLNGVTVQTRDMSLDDIRHIFMTAWGVRVGYELHRRAFFLLNKLCGWGLLEGLTEIARFVAGPGRSESGLPPDDFYTDYAQTQALTRHFDDFMRDAAQAERGALRADFLPVLRDLAAYEFRAVMAKCFDLTALFDSFDGPPDTLPDNTPDNTAYRLRPHWRLASRFDLHETLAQAEQAQTQRAAAEVVQSALNSARAPDAPHHYLFFGKHRVEIDREEAEVLDWLAGRTVTVQDGDVVDTDSGESRAIAPAIMEHLKNVCVLWPDTGEPQTPPSDETSMPYYV